MFEVLMTLAFIVIFILTHIAFKNIKDICIWSCKLITTTYLWGILWVVTQLHRLPDWKTQFSDSVWTLVNATRGEL